MLHWPRPPTLRALMHDDDLTWSATADRRWRELRDALVRAVRRQCPGWLSHDADDIAQAALTKVMARERAGAVAPLSSFYLYKVAHSALVDEIRRRKRRREEPLEPSGPGEEPRSIEPRAVGDTADAMRLRELGVAVQACLRAMKRERRLAVMLYLQEHTVPEAARVLGWVVKRTENLVYRGLADLRQCLQAKGHVP
jgi:RNA polymerase sigma-70 factor (ECF subfamily)